MTPKTWLLVPMGHAVNAPLWICLCGARNRLRDTTCRNCGDPAPDWKDDYDDAKR